MLLRAAVIFGFLGMFRFSSYAKLGLHNLVVVGKNAIEYQIMTGALAELQFYFDHLGAIGFYFRFPSKYHPLAYAFFCKLSSISGFWSKFCPVQTLCQLAQHKLLSPAIFPSKIISSEKLKTT